MTSHPTPGVIAAHLRNVANLLADHGRLAIDLADVLASRGLPANTLGDGSRTSADSTSTERAAGLAGDPDDNTTRTTRWDDIDVRLARLLHLIWKVGLDVEGTIGDIVARADDLDALPAGSGHCVACGNFIRPDHKHPDRRIRSGYCPSCHSAWIRWRQRNHPDRAAFVRWRRADLLARAQERERKQRLGA